MMGRRSATSRVRGFVSQRLNKPVLVGILVGAATLTAAWKWPFTRKKTLTALEQISQSRVEIGTFSMTFFPHPGYVAQNVTFTRDEAPSHRPLVRVAKIVCQGSWLNLLSFTHRIPRIDLAGAQFYIPAHVPPAIRKREEAQMLTTVTDLYANGTVLEIAPRHGGSKTIRFEFHELSVSNLARNKPIHFRTLMVNTGLIGRLSATGTIGPLTLGRLDATRVGGDFQLKDDDLSSYKVIAGTLSADGRFQGTLGRVEVNGRTEIRNFEIRSSHHTQGLAGAYEAIVDGIKGDVAIRSARVRFLNSMVAAHGSIQGDRGKTLLLDLDSSQTRVEDLLHLFVKADKPVMYGAMRLQAHVILPPQKESFLKRVQLYGNFAITGAGFTRASTAAKLNELSTRALGRGKPKPGDVPERVLAEITSSIRLERGTATFTQADFMVPGALARGAGTFNVLNEGVDMRGKLALRTTLSKAAGGMKSVLLLPLDPFFKKDGAGTVLPVRITGTYSHPVFKVSLTK